MNYAIIAAGEGSRLAQEGVALPKPLVRLNGEPMLQRLINIFLRCQAQSISLIVNERMTEVREFVDTLDLPVPLNVVVKSTPSSMHSFWELSRVLPEGKFCLTTVDTIFREADFARYISAFEADDTIDGLWGVTPFIDDEKPLYVEVDETMRITAFRDKPFDGMRYVSGGIYGMTHHVFPLLNDCIENNMSRMRNFQRALVEAGFNLRAHSFDKIVDVDHASDIEGAQRFLNTENQ